jgi:hypothetical protein
MGVRSGERLLTLGMR